MAVAAFFVVSLIVAALVIVLLVGRRRVPHSSSSAQEAPARSPPAAPLAASPAAANDGDATRDVRLTAERARVIRSFEAEAATLRRALLGAEGRWLHATTLDEDRRAALRALAAAGSEVARYRQLVQDIENHAPPPLLDSPGAPDDLKLIVGVGPVLERMLHQLGIGSYRQIARWTEQDVDAFDARLHEFPGRIRRDGWVTQARELHASKYGEPANPRERR